ncbi:MAG: GntR family transcriptional regulator [Pantoea sp. Morm]|uniref:GntR family transcriptional regulator n=1 Tax=Pantoea sp. Morm TaxID=2601250 RepID=UPI001D38CD9D|nr:GntR family transcriptional regulator [Pantoea sp. Morm]
MFTEKTVSKLPRYQFLYDLLSEQIAANRWLPGELFPTEAALASEFRLSTGTVRKAIDLLVAEGILEKQQGRGTFVRRPRFDFSLFRFFRFSSVNGKNLIPDSTILSMSVQKPSDAASDKLKLNRENSSAIKIKRLRTLAGEPLLYEEIWLPLPLFSPLLDVDIEREGMLLYPLYEKYCGQMVAFADEALTAEAAENPLTQVLQIREGTPVIAIERVARNFAGEPLEWRRSLGSAQHFSYSIQIR